MKKISHIFSWKIMFLIFGTIGSIAWIGVDTGFSGTHGKITQDAIHSDDINSDEYPDLYRFYDDLVSGSNFESHNVPGDRINYQVWAPVPDLWWSSREKNLTNITDNYDNMEFNAAYTRIGYMLHLYQDEFSPAHEKVCAHGYKNIFRARGTDDLEMLVWGRWSMFYYGYISSKVNYTFTNRHGTWQYWLSDQEDDDIGGINNQGDNLPDDPILEKGIVDGPIGDTLKDPDKDNWGLGNDNWGTYGYGGYLTYVDPLPGRDNGEDFFNEHPNPELPKYKLWQALNKTKEKLIWASKHLPPIIEKRPTISPMIFGPNSDPVMINFTVVENRTRNVFLYLSVMDVPIRSFAGLPLNGGSDSVMELYTTKDKKKLPYTRNICIYWKGDLVNGTLDDGEHILRIQVIDGDNIGSTAYYIRFRYDKTSPTGIISVY